jgi:two-component system sensor histidine kinase EvgS
MNVILGFTEILSRDMEDTSCRKYLEAITASGTTLMSLINGMLDLSKIESGKLEIMNEPVDVKRLVGEIADIFSGKAEEKGLNLSAVYDAQQTWAVMDAARLRQMLFNIVGNAVKFTEEGWVRINFKTEPVSENRLRISISVADTGVGIAKDQQREIFNSFTQQKGQNYGKYGGTGLGLAITKKLAELMNGRIMLESEPGKGSTFTLVFEDVESVALRDSHSDAAEKQYVFDYAAVLVVDDSEPNRFLVSKYLEPYNLALIEAKDGEEAVRLAREHVPDLIIMDLKMPGMDGLEATSVIKNDSATEHIPVILITADVLRGREQEAILKGCSAYLKKPLVCSELTEMLSRFLPHRTIETKKTETKAALTPEQRDVVRRELACEWKRLSKAFIINDIKSFAETALQVSRREDIKDLQDWASGLAKDANEFDIESLTRRMNEFKKYLEETL